MALVDRGYTLMTGYSKESVHGIALNRLLARPLAAEELLQIEDSLLEKATWTQTVVLKCANGTRVDVNMEVRALACDGINKVPFVAVLTEIPRETSARSEVEELRSRLDAVESVLSIGSLVFESGSYRVVQISSELMAMLELTDEELASNPEAFFFRIHPEDRERTLRVAQISALEQKGFDVRYRVVLPSGQVRWFRVRATPREAVGTPMRMTAVAFDVTEQVLAQRSLELAEQRYHAAAEASRDALVLLEVKRGESGQLDDFVVADLNGQAAILWGWVQHEVVGRRLRELAPELHRGTFIAKCIKVMDSGVSLQETTPGATLGIGVKWLRWHVVPLGEGVAVSVGDVSWGQELTQQLAQTSRLESIGSLAIGVAHDFNNMLSAIIGFGELARDALPQQAQTRDDIEQVMAAADRAAKLTRYLLAFGSRQPVEPQLVDIGAQLQDLLPILTRLAGPSIRITLAVKVQLSTWLDPSLLEQAIVNLVVNAKDAMPSGGILRITAEGHAVDARHDVCLRGCAPGEYIHLAVSDNGEGMSELTRGRVFEPFFTTKSEKGGTGLGLASVYGFVKQSGGTVLVESAIGQGTTVRLYLPLVRIAKRLSSAPVPDRSVKRMRHSATLLIVESDESVRSIARRVLELNGFTVFEASNAATAQVLLDSKPLRIDVLLTAMRLPITGGIELARRLRNERPKLQILLMSGAAETKEIEDATFELDALFVQKPFSTSTLMARVRCLLERNEVVVEIEGRHEIRIVSE